MVDHLHIQFKVRQDLKAANVISDKRKVKKTENICKFSIFKPQTLTKSYRPKLTFHRDH